MLRGTYHGRKTGTFGKLGSFSFDTGKTMTTGEGGLVVTDDDDLYRIASEYADHGHMHDPRVPRGQDPRREPGFNFRMNELQGAVGDVQRTETELCACRASYKRVGLRASTTFLR